MTKILSVLFFLSLFYSSESFAQLVTGDFRALKAEKINGNYYVIGIKDKTTLRIIKYDENLELKKEFSHQFDREIYIAPYTIRNRFDIRIASKGNIVVWLAIDFNLKELGLEEHRYSIDSADVPSKENVYNPVYSVADYFSNFNIQRTYPGFYVNNSFYHFLFTKSSEFTNTNTESFTYYKGEPMFRKLVSLNDVSPFYKETKRVKISEDPFLSDFSSMLKYSLKHVKSSDGFIYFLASKKTKSYVKDDIKLFKANESSLKFEPIVNLNLDSLIPELGSTFFAKTIVDTIHDRIIQIGNYTGKPYTSRWWEYNNTLHTPNMKLKGIYICEFDFKGHVKKYILQAFPDDDISFGIDFKRFYTDYKAFLIEDNGIRIEKNGSIQIVGENCVLTSINNNSGPGSANTRSEFYTPYAVTFMNIDSTLQKPEIKVVETLNARKLAKVDAATAFSDFDIKSPITQSTALFEHYDTFSGEKTNVYSIYSGYYGVKTVTLKRNDIIFLFSADNSLIFTPANKDKVYEFSLLPHRN